MRVLASSCLVLLFTGLATAQKPIVTSPYRVYQTMVGPQSIVRDSGGNLYVIYRYMTSSTRSEIAIGRSTDGGLNWAMSWMTGFAANPSGDYGNYSQCIAIDSKDNLHCAWFHRVATSGSRIPRTTRYNRFDAATQKWGAEWTVTNAKYELDPPCLVVDQNDYVWFAYGNHSSSWRTVVDRSNLPTASDLKFTRYSPAFTSSGSSQKVDMVVDAVGRIHISYYDNNTSNTNQGAGVKHQWIDPGATSPKWTWTPISGHVNTYTRADYYSSMAADNAGNVYAVYTVDDQASTTGPDPQFFIRKWNGSTQTWGAPVLFYKVARATWEPASGQHNDGRIIAAACDETTGEVYFTYRDFTSGEYRLARWRGNDQEPPTTYAKLMSTGSLPATTRNYFIYPQFRGSLHPRTNRTSIGLDLLYTVGDQGATTPQYTLYYEHFPIGSMGSTGAPKIGTTYPIDLSGLGEGGKPYIAALTMSGLMPFVQIGRRFVPLTADTMFFLTLSNVLPGIFVDFQNVMSAGGTGRVKVVIPNVAALVGLPLDGCFLTYDVGGVRAISNPWGFRITS